MRLWGGVVLLLIDGGGGGWGRGRQAISGVEDDKGGVERAGRGAVKRFVRAGGDT